MNTLFNGGLTQRIEPYSNPIKIQERSPSNVDGFFFPVPTGENTGDIMYWDTSAGTSGAWIKLDAPINTATENSPETLTYDGSDLFWNKGIPNGENKGDLLYWDPNAGNGGAWAVLEAPTQNGTIMYWDGQMWNFISPPSGTTIHALTILLLFIAWCS